MSGRDGDDKIFGGAGNDNIFGDDSKDQLNGDAGKDIIKGGAGPDTLDGGSGNDRLRGGKGDDDLKGGPGSDTFVFIGTSLGHDIVQDFERNVDALRLVGQSAADISIVMTSPGNFEITHAQGVIDLNDASNSFTVADILFL